MEVALATGVIITDVHSNHVSTLAMEQCTITLLYLHNSHSKCQQNIIIILYLLIVKNEILLYCMLYIAINALYSTVMS